jgi:polar amino acid transport system substrate-binding protein
MKVRALLYPLLAVSLFLAACAQPAAAPTPAPTKAAEKPKEAPPSPSPAVSPSPSPAAAPAAKAPAVALPKPGDMPAGSFMKTIQDRGRLNAGVKSDVLLFGYLNPRANRIEGFDVDIVKEIARAIFGDPEKVELKEVTSAQRIPALKEGIVDLVAATMTITKARLDEIDFADVYYESSQLLLVPKNSTIKSIADTAGKRICAAKGSTSEVNITKAQAKAEVVQADKYTDCLLAVQQGRADGVSTDDVILLGLAEQDPNMQIVGAKFSEEPYGLGFAKGKPEFVQFVNGVLTSLKQSGRWKAIHQQWLGKYIPTPEPPTKSAQEAAV